MYVEGFRRAALKLYDYCGNMKTVSMVLGISTSTIWRWVKLGMTRKHRTSFSPKKLTESIMEFIHARLCEQPTTTHHDLRVDVMNTFQCLVSRQCVATAIRLLNFSRKRLSKRGITNKEKHAIKLQLFKESYEQAKQKSTPIVAIDEVGFDFRDVPLYGYSLKGTKAISQCLHMQRKRTTMLMAIDRFGNFHCRWTTDNVTANHFAMFIDSLPWQGDYSILMDNASIHKAKALQKHMSQHNVMFTPPYSPDCNPIENVFSVIKHRFRNRLMRQDTKHHEIIQEIVHGLNHSSLFGNCFAHMESFLRN